MALIETHKLTKYYLHGKVLGVNKLDLEINEGEVFGFIGPNGAGKTTTIRLLLDLIRPTSGESKIFGLDSHKNSVEIKKEIGFLPGEIYLPDNMIGKECIEYYKGFKDRFDDNYIKHLQDRLDFDPRKKVRDYSKGNRQKLGIILALMAKPKLLILDEPTSGLDPLNQQEFYNLIKATKQFGTTVFLSTHILIEAEKICDRVGIIKGGKLLKVENIDQFREKNIREIHLETKENIPLSSLRVEGVRKVERNTSGYKLTTVGLNGKIFKELAKLKIDDFKVNEPSLEEIFMHYYEKND